MNTLRATAIGDLSWLLPGTARKGVEGSEVTRGPFKILADGNPQKVPRMVPNQRLGTPLFSCPPFHEGNVIGHTRGPGPASLHSATGRRIVPSIPESLFGRAWGCFGGPVGVRDGESPAGRGSRRVMPGIHSPGAKSLVTPRMQDGVRGTSSRCGGGFAKQVAGNVDKGEAPTFLRERLEIRLDENLDGLFAGINLDTNRRVAKVDLVASSVCSANNGVGHYRLASQGSPAISDHLRPVQAPKAEQLWSGTARAVGST